MGLSDGYRSELAGILNWSLRGLDRLANNQNQFTRLATAEDILGMMRDLASPITAFVRERCEIGADKEIEIGLLFDAFRGWCEANNYPTNSKAVFARDLRAAYASIRVKMPGTHNRVRHYVGIGLRTEE